VGEVGAPFAFVFGVLKSEDGGLFGEAGERAGEDPFAGLFHLPPRQNPDGAGLAGEGGVGEGKGREGFAAVEVVGEGSARPTGRIRWNQGQ